MCPLSQLLDGTSHRVVFRMTHKKVVEGHNLLLSTYIESMKRLHAEDCKPLLDPPLTHEAGLVEYSQLDYPKVHFWKRKEWKDFNNKSKNSSGLQGKKGTRGGARSAKGENVMMLYIEHPNGKAIDGVLAAEIREFARSIWRGLYALGMAPRKWRDSSRDAQDKYTHEMEKKWPVLRYCENH